MEAMMNRAYNSQRPARQRGATLIIALLILVLIMMIGITAVSTSDTQFKLAGNLQFEDSALNSAESAVTAAESWISTANNFSDPGFTAFDATKPQLKPLGYMAGLVAPANSPLTMAWGDTNSVAIGGNGVQRYYVELMSRNNKLQGSSQVVGGRGGSGCNEVNTYLITARGTSARGATKFVQSFYSVLNCPT
jgi:Tfp pilus assembly protein PilX